MSPDQRMAEQITDRSTEVKDDVASPRKRLDLSIPQLLAGALAAASAAVAASWLGVAGTLTGAVVASIVVSVSSALYKHSLERSSQVIRENLPVLPVLPDRYRAGYNTTSTETRTIPKPRAPRRPTGASAANARRIRWSTVAITSLLTLVIGFGLLTAVEGLLGSSVESLTGSHDKDGGTTVSRLFNHGSSNSGPTTKPSSPASSATTGSSSTAPTTAPTTTGGAPDSTAPPTQPPTTTAPPPSSAPVTTAPPSSQSPTG
jgi:hypothetical protein